MKRKISVIGAGSMGTAIAILLSNNGNDVMIWTPFKEEADMINTYREQKEKLPGAIVPEEVVCTDNLVMAVNYSDILVFVIPSQTIRENAAKIAAIVKAKPSTIDNSNISDSSVAIDKTNSVDNSFAIKTESSKVCKKVFVCFSKGLEKGTGLRMSEVIREEIPGALVVAMSGPCHAEELSKGIPTAYVAASLDRQAAELVQDCFMSQRFRVYTNPDIIGVELGGAIKNVIALCAGISDGLGFGDNTKAALMTRGIAEMSRLGSALGAQVQTFSGLAGIGDLIVTCTSMHSRNRRAGILIGQGMPVEDALKEVKMVVEGVYTTEPVYKLASNLGVKMPITSEAYEILYNGKDARQAVVDLMNRDRTHEPEQDVLADIW